MNRLARLAIGLVVAIGALITFWTSREKNELTGETQHVALTVEEEKALGLQAAPEMAQQFGGFVEGQEERRLEAIGQELVRQSLAGKSEYRFDFHLLADPQTVNAFALPGGQIFITRALYNQLKTDGELAGVLGHEIGHVIHRHSAEQLARQRLTEGLGGAAVIASDNPATNAQIANIVGGMVNMRYGREDELESDKTGVQIMASSGYDPRGMIQVMRVLQAASGGQGPPEFMSTHPNPENRIGQIEQAIGELYPQGVPEGMRR